ncbi:MAG: hypothetical protein Q9168_008095 [Polycauliona sp. 1 TL-2023]
MAPSPITDDYYLVLEVDQNATLELIKISYKRLALKLHPDRNAKPDATQAFQLLGRAYETLKDQGQRKAYDLVYPSLKRNPSSPQSTQTPRPPTGRTPHPESVNEAAQIVALQKSKQERAARWQSKQKASEASMVELQIGIRDLEQQIKILDFISKTEAAEEAQKNSWTTWLLSPITVQKAKDTEEEKARKDRERQERRIEKDMKERRLALKKADLKKEQDLSSDKKAEKDVADRDDDVRIGLIQVRIRIRELQERQKMEKLEREKQERERQERAKVERERWAKIWQKQREERETREREEAETLRKQQAEWAAGRKRQEEETKKWRETLNNQSKRNREPHTHSSTSKGSTRQAYKPTCSHDGWWSKIQGRTGCPECNDVWTYLLQCPSCDMKACPKCQAAIRRRIPRNTPGMNRRAPPRERTPTPNYFDYD